MCKYFKNGSYHDLKTLSLVFSNTHCIYSMSTDGIDKRRKLFIIKFNRNIHIGLLLWKFQFGLYLELETDLFKKSCVQSKITVTNIFKIFSVCLIYSLLCMFDLRFVDGNIIFSTSKYFYENCLFVVDLIIGIFLLLMDFLSWSTISSWSLVGK